MQASSVTGDLSVQPICSDGTSMPILGDSRDWYRVVGINHEPQGYVLSHTPSPGPVPLCQMRLKLGMLL
jgi:hypothetical protein